jgi:hypothetical protein
MAGGKIIGIVRQHLKIQAFGFRQSSAALQRNGLIIQSVSIHVCRTRPAWYPFANCEKQVAVPA